MSFFSHAITSLGKAVGLIPDTPSVQYVPVPAPAPAPTVANSTPDLDAAAQNAAKAAGGGLTSTMLTGGAGETEDKKYTSKVLLGQ